jgi:hypothetical protein
MFAAFFAAHAVLGDHTAGGPGPSALFDLCNVKVETLCLLASSLTCGLSSMGRVPAALAMSASTPAEAGDNAPGDEVLDGSGVAHGISSYLLGFVLALLLTTASFHFAERVVASGRRRFRPHCWRWRSPRWAFTSSSSFT